MYRYENRYEISHKSVTEEQEIGFRYLVTGREKKLLKNAIRDTYIHLGKSKEKKELKLHGYWLSWKENFHQKKTFRNLVKDICRQEKYYPNFKAQRRGEAFDTSTLKKSLVQPLIFEVATKMDPAVNNSTALGCEDIKDEDSIPLADDDPSAEVVSEAGTGSELEKWRRGCESLDSIPSMISDNMSMGLTSGGPSSLVGMTASHVTEQMNKMCMLDPDDDFSPDEAEEKARLISQVYNFCLRSVGTLSFS